MAHDMIGRYLHRLVIALTASLLTIQGHAFEPDVFRTQNSVSNSAVSKMENGSSMPCLFRGAPSELTLVEAIERILCHDPQTRMAWATAKVQAAQLGIARSAYLPRLTSNISGSRNKNHTRYEDAVPSYSIEGRQDVLSGNLNLSWILFDFGRRRAALDAAKQLLIAANASQDATLQNAFVSAAQSYYDAVAARHSLAASQQVEDMAAENLKAADAKYKAGAAALADRLQAQTAYTQSRLNRIRYAGQLQNALGNIALLMGLPPETPFELATDMNILPDTEFVSTMDRMLAEARRQHPSLVAAQAQVKAAQANIREARAMGRPSIGLTASMSRNRTNRDFDLGGDLRGRDKSIALEVDIPLFEGFERTYQIRNALAREELGRAELSNTEQQVSLTVWGSYQSLSVETESLKRTTEWVDQARQSLEVVQGRYRSGVGNMVELLNALTAYADAEERHIQTLASWQTSRLQLAAGLGRLGFWAVQSETPPN